MANESSSTHFKNGKPRKKRSFVETEDAKATNLEDHEPHFSPLESSYNAKIRPILDAVDKLRRLKVTEEGIPLPTIVVVGDQSSGKSSVLESLAGISLPRGEGICTRVPLIMRIQDHSDPEPEFLLEYPNREQPVKISDESQISKAISKATLEVAGKNKGITNKPLTLMVKKKGVPNLTMIDLPGITRVAIGDQPKDIYKQVSDIIMEHIKPEESIILNVISADVDFTTCESICMSGSVDSTGQRTLAVVTKCDRSPKGLYEKVTANDVNIGLGYICVRNRINDESYEEARIQETELFETHPLLSKIDKSMVGVPVLAARLVQIQSMIISKCLPNIVTKINEKLDAAVSELNRLPHNLTSTSVAMATVMRVVGSLKETLQLILIRGEFHEYPEEKQMHGTARMVEMSDELAKELHKIEKVSGKFLVEEMQILEESNIHELPQFLQISPFHFLLRRKLNDISALPVSFVNKVWSYLEKVIERVLLDRCGYPQLLTSMKKATKNMKVKMKDKFVERVNEMIEMEKITAYTCDPEYTSSYKKLNDGGLHEYLKIARSYHHVNKVELINVEGDTIDIKHLVNVPTNKKERAFELKIRMEAYWKIVLKRMMDTITLYLRFQIQEMLKKEIETEILDEMLVCGGMEKMMKEPASLVQQREKLQKSIALLKESKEIIEEVMGG